MAGLGQDMIGYLFPPGNFVGDRGETDQSPWAQYQLATNAGSTDRHGYHHSDDSESLGPHAGLAVARGIASLLTAQAQPAHDVVPGLFVDAGGHLSDGPFADTPFPFQDAQSGFQGAAGVEIAQPGGGTKTYLFGKDFNQYVTFESRPDPGTAGTTLPYSVSTAGILLHGKVLLIDVFKGANALLPPPSR